MSAIERTISPRTIKIVSPIGGESVITISSNARCFSQLKDDMKNHNSAFRSVDLSKYKFTVKQTMNSLEEEDALIPETDCAIFVVAKKNISSGTSEEMLRTYSTKNLEKKLKSANCDKKEKAFITELLKQRASKSSEKPGSKSKKEVKDIKAKKPLAPKAEPILETAVVEKAPKVETGEIDFNKELSLKQLISIVKKHDLAIQELKSNAGKVNKEVDKKTPSPKSVAEESDAELLASMHRLKR